MAHIRSLPSPTVRAARGLSALGFVFSGAACAVAVGALSLGMDALRDIEIAPVAAVTGILVFLASYYLQSRATGLARARLLEALEDSAVGFALMDRSGRTVSANPAFASFSAPLAPEHLATHRAGSEARAVTFADGRAANVENHPMRGGGTLSVVTNITELKRQEDELAKRAAYLETLLGNIEHGVVLFDENWLLAACNARFSETLDLPFELSKPGVPVDDIIRFRTERGDYGQGDAVALAAERIRRVREPVNRSFEDTLPGGRIVKLTNIKLPRGGMVTTVIDVTARRKAEADRQSSEAYFRMMANSAPVLVWACDEAGQITFLNRRWLEFRGGSLEQERARPWADIVHPEDAANFFAVFDEAISTRQTHTCEYRLRRHDGQYRWIILTAVPRLEGDGALAGFLGSALDITDRKRDEDMLRQSKDQAVAASRTKSELLANMSHELRTPLNAIIGFSEIMKDEMFGPLGHVSYQEYAHDIHESGKHLLTLINDILDVSKAEAGKIELDEELVDVRPVMESCVRLVKARAEANGLALEIKLPGNPPKLFADERRVKQIFLNLLSNAVKFTLPGGRVHVDATQRADGSLALTVNDTGIGIAPEDLPRVLAPFGQAESGLNRKYDGTGLGLTLTKALVELHGGTLEIDSVKGVGTKVSAVFPAARVRAPDALPELSSARGRLRRARAAGAR